MAVVNVSLDTVSRNVVLTINGVMVAQDGCSIDRYIDHEGEETIYFSYVVENVNESGIKERRQFYLLSPEEAAVADKNTINEDGFASKVVHNDEKAKADIIEFFKRDSKDE